MTDLCFLDTETLGLDPKAPIWEFAAIRRRPDGHETSYHCFIEHRPDPWLAQLPEPFQTDYLARYRYSDAEKWSQLSAARLVYLATEGAHIVGNVPSFDTERLTRLMRKQGYAPAWHYHLIDVENLAVGRLAARSVYHKDDAAAWRELITPPWDSEDLSRAMGVNPEKYDRHTAMGDVLWARDTYDAVTWMPS